MPLKAVVLTQLAQYCSALVVEPSAIRDDHVLGLLKTLTEETFTDKPDQVVVNAVKTWNRVRGKIDGWPDIELARPPRKREPWGYSAGAVSGDLPG